MRGTCGRLVGWVVAAFGVAGAWRSASGDIIYQDIPDVTLTLPESGNASLSAGIDFLDDGSNEFTLTLERVVSAAGASIAVTLGGTFPMAQVFVDRIGTPSAGTLFAPGGLIGPVDIRTRTATLYQLTLPGTEEFGLWRGPVTGFAGISIDGFLGPNFGWARMTVDVAPGNAIQSVTLHDFAFEGVARVPIAAGAVPGPGALGAMLAMIGALAGRRRR